MAHLPTDLAAHIATARFIDPSLVAALRADAERRRVEAVRSAFRALAEWAGHAADAAVSTVRPHRNGPLPGASA